MISAILVAVATLQGVTGTSLREQEIIYPKPHPSYVFEVGVHDNARGRKRRQLSLPKSPDLTPTYPGYGSHFSYLYVGNPPQRQAVIIDTASSWTAFPCTGCKDCGTHLNDYFNPALSTTYKEDVCDGKKKCLISNTYSTAQWTAYTGTDNTFIAGNDMEDVTDAKDYTFKLKFGCMQTANPDMKDQAADGVLGMAMAPESLPFQYTKEARLDDVFSLCLRQGGGIFSLGGVDPDVQYPDAHMLYTPVSNQSSSLGFWTVTITKLRFQAKGQANNKKFIEIGTAGDLLSMQRGKGTIIDSATSQTYFPKAMGPALAAAFKEASGVTLQTRKSVKLTAEQIKNFPTLLISMKAGSKTVTVKMPPSDYLETNGDDLYNIMLGATEDNGAVLGANFLTGYNVVFDKKNKRIGFAESPCRYADFHDAPGQDDEDGIPAFQTCGEMKPISECTAVCAVGTTHDANYLAIGEQDWGDGCEPPTRVTKTCHVPCSKTNYEIIAPENLQCPAEPWSECSKKCTQSRTVHSWTGSKCEATSKKSRECYAGQCPTSAGDYLIFIDMKIYMTAPWSSATSEDVFNAIAAMFNIAPGNVEALVDSGAFVGYKKVQIQIRLRAKDYYKKAMALLVGQSIVDRVNEDSFSTEFVYALNKTSYRQDFLDFSRFGWMIPGYDILLLSVTGFPISSKDLNPDYQIDEKNQNNERSSDREEQLKLILIGVMLAAFLVVGLMGCLYCRLRRQYWDLEKGKGIPGNLKAMWERYKAKKRFKHSDYRKVRSTEMTQTVGSPFEEDEFDAALDYADDVNG